MQYGNLKFYYEKFYTDIFYYNYVVWKFCIAKFYYKKFYYEKFNIKEVAHHSKSAVTFKKLHKIYIDVAFYYADNNIIIGE